MSQRTDTQGESWFCCGKVSSDKGHCLNPNPVEIGCGFTVRSIEQIVNCTCGKLTPVSKLPNTPPLQPGEQTYCCGNVSEDHLQCTAGTTNNTGAGTEVGNINFQDLNNIIFKGAEQNIAKFSTPRGIISYLLPFLFTLAGLILFVMIIWGGFEMLTGAADPKSQQAGQQRITAGIIGFLIIFAAYWLAQLLQTIFGISILG